MRARVQGDLLCSDMSAFKAANPGCTLGDFVRWHSPRDWEGDSSGGGQLSARMQQQVGMLCAAWQPALPDSLCCTALACLLQHGSLCTGELRAVGGVAAGEAPAGNLCASPCLQDGMWQILWAAAPAVPAARQKPLMDPVLEGERVLHYLETLPPAVLWDQLLACGIAAAAGKLAACPGASLPMAAQAVAK